MEKYSCHDTPFLCEYCQSHGLTPKRVETPKLELLRVKERRVLRMKSEPRPCECDANNNSKHNVDQKATQTLKMHKTSKTAEHIARFPHRNYEKEVLMQGSVIQEPSTSKAYSFGERTERKQRALPEEATTSNRNDRNTPKLWRSLKSTILKIPKASDTDDTSSITRKLQTRESSKKRKVTHVPEQYSEEIHSDQRSARDYADNQYLTINSTVEDTTSSSEYSHEQTKSQINGKSEESELDKSWYRYRKHQSKSKEKGTKPSLIPVTKRRQTPRVAVKTSSNSGQDTKIIKPFIESASKYKLLRVSQIGPSSGTSQSSVEEKHSNQEVEDPKDSQIISQTGIKEYSSKTKTPPPIEPKPKHNKMKIVKESQQYLETELNKEEYKDNDKLSECTNENPVLELSENVISKNSDLERKHSSKISVQIPQSIQPTVEQSLSTSINKIIVSNQESDIRSPKPELSIGSMPSSSYILGAKFKTFESGIRINVPNSSQENANCEKVESTQFFEATKPVKETTTKYSDCSCESFSQKTKSQQKYGTTVSSDSIQQYDNDKTLNECSYVSITKIDSFEPIQQDCDIEMDQERSPELTLSDFLPENMIDRGNDHGTSTESSLAEDLKEYKQFRNYHSLPKLGRRSNELDIENSDHNPLSLKEYDELENQLLNENSQPHSNEMLHSDNDELQDSLSMIFEQVKKNYKERKFLEETQLLKQKMHSFRLYEYTPDPNEKYSPCEEKVSHGSRKPYRKKHSLPQSFKSIEDSPTCRSPELSTISESTDSEQFLLQNSAGKRQEYQRECIGYESIKNARDVAEVTDLNEYRQGSNLDNRLLKPFKYPTSIYERLLKYQPMIEPWTARTKSVQSKQTQTLPEEEHAHWEHSKTTTRNRVSKQQKSINSESEESERSLVNMPLNDLTGKNERIVEAVTENLLTNHNQPIDVVNLKSSQDGTKSSKDTTLNQQETEINLSSKNRRDRRTLESIGNNVSKKERQSSYCRDPPNKQTRSKPRKKTHKENKILENKGQTDCDSAWETLKEERILINKEFLMKNMNGKSEKDALQRRRKKREDARVMKNRSSAENITRRKQEKVLKNKTENSCDD